jgi:hypothetical protein
MATNAITDCGVGIISVASSGMMTSAARTIECVRIESGTVYHFLVPTRMDGFAISPNMSRGTLKPPSRPPRPTTYEGPDYSQPSKRVSTKPVYTLDTGA